MRKIFTSILSVVAICVLLLGTADSVQVQTTTTLESGAYYAALAKDRDIYCTRLNVASNTYELVKYIDGTGTPVVLQTGIGYSGIEYPWGILVASNGDVYYADCAPDNKVVS